MKLIKRSILLFSLLFTTNLYAGDNLAQCKSTEFNGAHYTFISNDTYITSNETIDGCPILVIKKDDIVKNVYNLKLTRDNCYYHHSSDYGSPNEVWSAICEK